MLLDPTIVVRFLACSQFAPNASASVIFGADVAQFMRGPGKQFYFLNGEFVSLKSASVWLFKFNIERWMT